MFYAKVFCIVFADACTNENVLKDLLTPNLHDLNPVQEQNVAIKVCMQSVTC